jgi:hypothetical protein
MKKIRANEADLYYHSIRKISSFFLRFTQINIIYIYVSSYFLIKRKRKNKQVYFLLYCMLLMDFCFVMHVVGKYKNNNEKIQENTQYYSCLCLSPRKKMFFLIRDREK